MKTIAHFFEKSLPIFISMLLIILTGLLFFFIALNAGYFFNELLKIYGLSITGFFSAILSGTMFLTVYLNTLSIFTKTDYWLLVVPLVFSCWIFFKAHFQVWLRQKIDQNIELLFSKNNLWITLPFLIVIALFTIVPPYNTDSSGYHFLSIKWNENFAAVPGLANLFPQFGYNSSFMVLSAAFSFTNIFHQSIYPINAVLTSLFFLWMLKKGFNYSNAGKLIIVIVLFVLLRQFPINLASPSADSLASILVFFVLFSVYEMDEKSSLKNDWQYLLLLSSFAIIIKLSTLPLLLVGLLPFLKRTQSFKTILLSYFKLSPLLLIVLVPWLVRNVILSGYLIFPFPTLDLFSFDWKVPFDVAMGEKIHISQGARMAGADWVEVSKMPFYKWFPKWILNVWSDNHFNFMLVVAGLLSPLLIALIYKRKRLLTKHFLFAFFISYSGILFWMITSPDIRFGYHYLLLCLIFPLALFWPRKYKWENVNNGYFHKTVIAISVVGCIYYGNIAVDFLKPYSISTCVIKPFISAEYEKNNDLKTFKYVMLTNNTKLYIHDSMHHTINVPLPSCSPYRRGIAMRGNNLQNGFKTQP